MGVRRFMESWNFVQAGQALLGRQHSRPDQQEACKVARSSASSVSHPESREDIQGEVEAEAEEDDQKAARSQVPGRQYRIKVPTRPLDWPFSLA